MKKLLIGAVLSLFAACPAVASDWAQIGHSDDGTILYIDRSSVQYNGTHAIVWAKNVYATPRQVTVNGVLKPFTTIVMQSDIDCANRTSLSLAGRFYDSNGELVVEIGASQAPRPIVPDSGNDWERQAVCR